MQWTLEVVVLPVSDIERAVAFYRMLGFELLTKDFDTTATMSNGDCRICLYQGHITETQLIFWQGHIDQMAKLAEDKDLAFLRPLGRDEDGEGFLMKDPDGTPLHFINMAKYRRPAASAAKAEQA